MMKIAALLGLALAPSLAVAQQNATFLTGLLSTLQSAGLTQLISVASTINGTAGGQQLLANISDGSPFVLFAPNNDAWASAPSNFTRDASVLTDVFSYHIVPGNFSSSATTYPNVTLGETLYTDNQTVRLEGNRPQVVAWAIRNDGKTHVLNQKNDSTVVNMTTYGNLTIYVIDHVLEVPEDFEDTIPADDPALSGFETLLRDATLAFYNSTTNQTSDIPFFDAFNTGYHGFTLFSANNSAVQAANSSLQSIVGNRSQINNVLFNHLINATLYSPLLAGSQNYTTQAGETVSFSINGTGQYVHLGNFTALIIQPDVLLPNGVIHVIDTVFLDTDSDPSAASSALASATSAATASQASQTAPIGFSQTQAIASSASSAAAAASSSGSSGSNGAVALGLGAEKFVGMAVAALGVVFGAMTLF